VYSLPKVGSTSLVSSLRIFGAAYFNIIHVHDENMLQHLLHEKDILINDLILYNNLIGKKVWVIDIYREPIERKISEFFEKISLHFNTSEENMNKYKIDTLVERFNLIYPHIHDVDPFLNQYDIPTPDSFDFQNKYLYVVHNSIHYIKLRLRDSAQWGTILSSLLQHTIKIVKDYETSNKVISQVYLAFKNKYTIPINYLDELKTNPVFQFYLNPREQEEYLEKWTNKTQSIPFESYTFPQYQLYMNIVNANNVEDTIQLFHYRDQGCVCKACTIKRCMIQRQILSEKDNADKIYHEECVNEYLSKKNKIVRKLVKHKHTNQFQQLRII
jgi:hypothetical protein